jgi:predicted GNAT family acetyltransferase
VRASWCDDGDVTDTSQIIDNTAASRFELTIDGRLAELGYRLRGNRLVILHTEVPPELEGRGLGGALVMAALDRAVREGLTVVPLCPFTRGWLQRHPDEAGRVAVDWGPADE